MDEADDTPPAKPSQTPSWVMLGFLVGVAFVLAIPRREPPRPAPVEASKVAPPPAPRQLSTIEAVFEAWGRYAVWSDNTTQVALWDPATRSFADCYEVLRVGDSLFFRSIPSLSRPVLTHGVVTESPLQFTETARQRDEWLREANEETWKAISAGARESLGTDRVAKPGNPH